MRTCKVMPTQGACRMCADTTDYYDQIPDCAKCVHTSERYELLEIVSEIFNDYAFVQAEGRIHKVSLDRVFDVKGE